MPPLAQIAIAVGCVTTIATGLFITTAALIRYSPADPGELATDEEATPDGSTSRSPG